MEALKNSFLPHNKSVDWLTINLEIQNWIVDRIYCTFNCWQGFLMYLLFLCQYMIPVVIVNIVCLICLPLYFNISRCMNGVWRPIQMNYNAYQRISIERHYVTVDIYFMYICIEKYIPKIKIVYKFMYIQHNTYTNKTSLRFVSTQMWHVYINRDAIQRLY
jgi:hypothetical protein